MADLWGVCLLPSTGEFAYDTQPAKGARVAGGRLQPLAQVNLNFAPTGTKTDYSYALDQLQAAHPECQTVALVVSWFGDSTDAAACKIYPSTTYIGGVFANAAGASIHWRVSGLTEASPGLIPISQSGGSFTYGGTPSDQSVVRCIQDLKARGFRVVFYPFILMDDGSKAWRGRIGLASDLSSAATTAVNAFLGPAAPAQFTRDVTNLTVSYAGSPTDYTYRRFILHYANLCVVAGGVDLFLLGSELRGLETIRGPGWTKTGTTDGGGHAIWDYPFVAGLTQLAVDVRGIFDGAGLTKNLTTLKNLIAYSADWSIWNGVQHDGAGQWPHLDALFSSASVDLVGIDNYMPLSDWTTAEGLDALNWTAPPPTSWPVEAPNARGLGLTGAPALHSPAYLAANIEGGEHFDWFYYDSENLGRGFDPNGSGLYVSLPEGDRLAQSRSRYYAGQELLGRKHARWWWNNAHRAIYDAGDGQGWVAHGPATAWTPQSKPMAFIEYGFATVDKCTNQPNLFWDASSSESGTPFWSIWDSADGAVFRPRRDDALADLGLQAIHDYWTAHNAASSGGVPMILTPFCCAWNWDARPFPTFPLMGSVWGDAGNWGAGNWIGGKSYALAIPDGLAAPGAGTFATFPTLAGQGFSVIYKPRFSTRVQSRASGREIRAGGFSAPLWDIELTFNVLRADLAYADLQLLAGFFANVAGQGAPFLFVPPAARAFTGAFLGTGDGVTKTFVVTREIGGFAETVQAFASAPSIYINGLALAANAFAVSILPAAVTFNAAPASGVALTIDFAAAHLARFVDDDLDLEEFMSGFWRAGKVRLETVRA